MRGKGQVQGGFWELSSAQRLNGQDKSCSWTQMDTAGYRQVLCPPETQDTTGQKSDGEAIICQRLRASSSQKELYPGEGEGRIYKAKTIITS